MADQQVIFRNLGIISYQDAWDLQEKLVQQNVDIKSEARKKLLEGEGQEISPASLPTTNYLLFCEHPPVYTLGKSGHMDNVLLSQQQLADKKIEFFHTNRGGDVTFHGPQQIVGYPILDLEKFYTDIGKYLRSLEEVIILTLADYGLYGERSPGETGVWLDPDKPGHERKICAMGIRCSRWITMHGFAFNINTDLSYFSNIIPCGIVNKKVTSMEKELGRTEPLEEVQQILRENFEKVFEVALTSIRTPVHSWPE